MTTLVLKSSITGTFGSAGQAPQMTFDNAAQVTFASNINIDYTQISNQPWINTGASSTSDIYKTSGKVGVGVSTPSYPVDVQSADTISIRAIGQVLATHFVGTSDVRAKEAIVPADSESALDIVNKVELVKFDFVDGNKNQVGFIAQQIVEHVPSAITKITEFIPNIYSNVDALLLSEDLLSVKLQKDVDIDIEDKVKIVLIQNGGKVPVVLTVKGLSYDGVCVTAMLRIPSGIPITVPPNGKLFVYGKRVDDFHVINKDTIYSYSVGAIQELTKRVEALEALLTDKRKSET
jgi:hypothetical protein